MGKNMVKVITYGTFDRLHYGHIRLLERAKALGDYLIVGITSDSFDIQRGKINVKENLIKRIENLKATNLCDEIIVEEYQGQKIDDIKKYNIDIFAIGSDWVGQFDYLNEYCKVVYLPRTQGVSSSQIRTNESLCSLAIVDKGTHIDSILSQAHFVNGIDVTSAFPIGDVPKDTDIEKITEISKSYPDLLNNCENVYISGDLKDRYSFSKQALYSHKNVICSFPPCEKYDEYLELKKYALDNGLKYIVSSQFLSSIAYKHFITLIKSQTIGKIYSAIINIDSSENDYLDDTVSSALLLAFNLNGTNNYKFDKYVSLDKKYTRISLTYDNSSVLIQVSPSLKNNSDITLLGSDGTGKLLSNWETSGHIEMDNIVTGKQISVNYDGNGIKYQFLSIIKNDYEPISDEIIENIYKLV